MIQILNKRSFWHASFLLVFFSAKSTARENDQAPAYYSLVHLAYVSLCKEDLNAAALMFDSAFSTMQPFFTDLNNALYVQINLPRPDKSKVKQYLLLLQQKGICVHEQYKDIGNYEPYLKLVNYTDCKQVIDSSLWRKVKEAMALDQVLRIFSSDSLGSAYDPRILPALDKADSVNYCLVDSILRLSLERNTPIEELIGYDAFSGLCIILLHNGPWGRYAKNIVDSITLIGLMDNRETSYLYDRNCTGHYRRKIYGSWAREQSCDIDCQLFGTLLFSQLNDKIYITGIDNIKRSIINNLRKLYNLPDVIEEAKIKAYIAFKLDDGLRYPGMTLISYEGAEETFEKNYQGYPYIRYLHRKDYNFKREFTPGK